MDQSIVNNEVDHSVDRDANAHRQMERRRREHSTVDQQDRDKTEAGTEDIIEFQRGVNSSIVMRLMNEPERSMEEILVDQPGKDLHADDGQKNRSAILNGEHHDERRAKIENERR